MVKYINIPNIAFIVCAILFVTPVLAEEPHPQSHEAIKSMGDKLEAARKAREAERKEKEKLQQNKSSQTDQADSGSDAKSELAKLKQQCDEAREARLVKLKKSAIEECIENKTKSPDECRKFYQDLGESGITQQGNFRQRRFHNIPECQPYYEAERKLRMNIK